MIATRPPARQLKAAYSLLYLLAMNRGGVRHSGSKGDYIWNANGRSVSDAQIQKQLDKLNDAYYDNVTRLAERLDSGNLSIPQWQERMRKEVKDVHRTNYIIGRGGVDKMTPRDWGRLGSDLRWMQYKALDGFALDIANGKRLPDGTFRPYSEAEIKARSRLYVNASNKQYWRGKTEAKMAAGYVEEQRFTHNNEPCNPCESEAAKGRQPIGTLAKPGEDCDGMTNCRCTMDYYKADEGKKVVAKPEPIKKVVTTPQPEKMTEKNAWKSEENAAQWIGENLINQPTKEALGRLGKHAGNPNYNIFDYYKDQVDISGIPLETTKKFAKEFERMINKHNLPKLSRWGTSTDDLSFAQFSSWGGDTYFFNLNPRAIREITADMTLDAYFLEGSTVVGTAEGNIPRFLAARNTQEAAVHETAHYYQYAKLGRNNKDVGRLFQLAMDTDWKGSPIANQISKYSTFSPEEFYAEFYVHSIKRPEGSERFLDVIGAKDLWRKIKP